ncbi:MAG: hypothetical protein WDO73_30690 [Ignavibacteriota bacterium]
MGGLVYVAVYRLAGFHSMPFRVVCFAILLLNLWLIYRVALRLTERRAVAVLATMLVTYHAWMVNLYYSTGTVYELLCVAFYLAAFDYYLGIRQSGRELAVASVGVVSGTLHLRAQTPRNWPSRCPFASSATSGSGTASRTAHAA